MNYFVVPYLDLTAWKDWNKDNLPSSISWSFSTELVLSNFWTSSSSLLLCSVINGVGFVLETKSLLGSGVSDSGAGSKKFGRFLFLF